jgi:high-affinity Fe2+/Pb2+ permease
MPISGLNFLVNHNHMKSSFLKLAILSVVVVLAACGQKSHEHDHEHGHDHNHEADADSLAQSPNDLLYEEVMKVHDEVMPKMNDIYKLKKELSKKAETATAAEKKKLEETIAALDSASESMMTWMHEFNPTPDTTGVDATVRQYLESEKAKVEKVKADMLKALEKAQQ